MRGFIKQLLQLRQCCTCTDKICTLMLQEQLGLNVKVKALLSQANLFVCLIIAQRQSNTI